MKLKSILMMLIVAICTVACSDDNEKEVTPVASLVAGTYNGALDMTVSGNNVGTSTVSVVLTPKSDADVSLTLINKEASTKGMSINHVEIEGVKVTEDGNGTYSLSKVAPAEGFTATDTGSPNKIVWKFTTFKGHLNKGVLELNMVAQPGAMPMPITLKFISKK